MPSAVRLREDYSVEELRALARRSKTVQPEPAASIAGCGKDGMDRGAAAKVGGIDRQTLRTGTAVSCAAWDRRRRASSYRSR